MRGTVQAHVTQADVMEVPRLVGMDARGLRREGFVCFRLASVWGVKRTYVLDTT